MQPAGGSCTSRISSMSAPECSTTGRRTYLTSQLDHEEREAVERSRVDSCNSSPRHGGGEGVGGRRGGTDAGGGPDDGGVRSDFSQSAIFCPKHCYGPMDCWYDCQECVDENTDAPKNPCHTPCTISEPARFFSLFGEGKLSRRRERGRPESEKNLEPIEVRF